MKASQANRRQSHASTEMLLDDRLLLLEEGHCLRDQALSYCRIVTPEARESFGASSLTTIVQMVANGYGVTLLPEMAIASEIHASAAFVSCPSARPQPRRAIGLAWRKTSPRKRDFIEFAELLRQAAPRPKTPHGRDAQ